MIDNVSSYMLHQSTLRDITRTQNELAKQQMQLSSGNNSQYFSEMAGQVNQYLSLDASMARTSQYLADNTVIGSRLDATSSSLGQVITQIQSLQSLISSRRTGTSNDAAFATQLDGLWQNITAQLNVSVSGQFIFSGTKLDTPAVSTTFPTLRVDGVPDTGYYQGSSYDLTARPQDNTVLQYNVRADAPGFQKVFAALAMAKTANNGGSDQQFEMAYDMAAAGLKDLIATQANVNANKVTLNNINQNHSTQQLYWKGIKEQIGNTDILAVSTQVSVNEGILQAAFQAFAKINSLRLSDFLR